MITLIISFLVAFLVYASLPEYAYMSIEFYSNGAIRKRRNDAILFDVYLEIPAHVISYLGMHGVDDDNGLQLD